MSASRRSFPGIAQAWIARGNGIPVPFTLTVKSLVASCDIAFLGDINPEITMLVSCEIDSDNIDTFLDILVNCSTTILGDINPTVTMNDVFVVVMVTNP